MAIHFFSQAHLLNTQPNTKAFGPVSGNLESKYRVCSLHTFSSHAIAYSVIKGDVRVQEVTGNTALVNLVLKPENVHVSGLKVKYFIYRGIRKDSLITGTSIAAAATNDLTAFIWQEHNKMVTATAGTANPVTGDPSQDILGIHLQSSAGTNTIDTLFVPDPNRVVPTIEGGKSIGLFDKDNAGFEIVMEGYFLDDTLDSLRSPDHVIDAGAFVNDFANKSIREKVTNYLDPCAFYGYVPTADVKMLNSGTIPASPSASDLFTQVMVPKFANYDVIYIDIRNHTGLSHVYYSANYDYEIHDLTLDGTTPVTQDYAVSKWPVFSYRPPAGYTVYVGDSTRFTFGFKKEIYEKKTVLYFPRSVGKDNSNLQDPMFFVNDENYFSGTPRQYFITSPASNDRVDFTGLKLRITAFSSGGSTSGGVMSNYFRLSVFHQIDQAALGSAQPKFPRESVFDNLFAVKQLPTGITPPATGSIVVKTGSYSYGQLEFKDDPSDANPRYIYGIFESYIAFEAGRVTLFAMLEVKHKYWGEYIEPSTIPPGLKPPVSFFKHLEDINKAQVELGKHEIKITATNKAPFLNFMQKFDKVASVSKPFVMLGISLSTAEYTQVLSRVASENLNQGFHPVYLQFNNITNANDVDNIAYKTSTLSLRGILNNGSILNKLGTAINISVYATEALFFSKNAGTLESMAVTPVRRVNLGKPYITIHPNLQAALAVLSTEKQNMFTELAKLDVFKKYFNKMVAAAGIRSLVFKHENPVPGALADCAPKGYQIINGQANPLEIIIRIKPSYLVEGSVVSIIRTILHEVIHAQVDYEMVRICGVAEGLSRAHMTKLKANTSNPNARIYADLYCKFGKNDDPPAGTTIPNDDKCERSYSHNYMASYVRADIEDAARQYEAQNAISRPDVSIILKDIFISPPASNEVPRTITKEIVYKALAWQGIDRTREWRKQASVDADSLQLFQLYTVASGHEINATNLQAPPLANSTGFNKPPFLLVTVPTPIQTICS
jgi:hypothetical protein